MRQIFLPACLCVVTWSGATSSDLGTTLDEYARGSLATKTELKSTAPIRLASLETNGFAVRDNETPRNRTGDIAIPRNETANAVAVIPPEKKQESRQESRQDLKTGKTPTVAEIAALIPDLAAEFPVPSGVVINSGIPEGIPLPPVYKPVVHRSDDEVCSTLAEAAQRNNIPVPHFIRLLFQESRFKAGAVSPVGAQGVAQFMPTTAEQMGLQNPFDPVEAIPASARLLRDLVRQFGNFGLAAAAYNAGPKRVADWLAAKGKSKLPEETQGYVKTITGKPVENWSAASAQHPPQKLPKQAPCQEAAGLLAYNGPEILPLPTPSPLRAAAKTAEQAKVADGKPVEKSKTVEKAADKTVEKTASKSAALPKSEVASEAAALAPPVVVVAQNRGAPKNILPPKRQKIASR